MTLSVAARRLLAAACLLAAVAALPDRRNRAGAAAEAGEGLGSISGQFIFEGEIPERRLLVAKGATDVNNPDICAADHLYSDELLIDAETRGIANVFVYLPRGAKVPTPLKASPTGEVVFDQKGCRFVPHALFVRTDQSVVVKSDDACNHNTHTVPVRGKGENFALKPKEREGVKLAMKVPENVPIPVRCDLHKWMVAYWLILDHPYAAISDSQGKFAIAGLPPGEYEFRIWHELPGYVQKNYKVKVEAGKKTELGKIVVPAAKLKDAGAK